ncbi:related to sulfate permease II [Cephalotrichum gorgonifer]|uniref:Related to sulfate permease II n=1 Tax=Cephalotrichum gorgonifer TaxID=2041049 RepID=A0AAE8MT09_9PEZI|nr:related to sulfate permease II [Cephalotrichum gorgonifer]
MWSNRLTHALTGVTGIDPHEHHRRIPATLRTQAAESAPHASLYLESEPTVAEWLRTFKPTRRGGARYIRGLFPSATWIARYNLRWLLADSIAGLTIGFVVVPQAMAYALLARLSPEYGLYTSFVGAAMYWLFGTSKDIVIGTTAVGSLLVGQVVTKVQEERPGVYSAEEVAKALSILAGSALLFLGLFRLGWLIEFIPYIPVSAFVCGASITVMSTQFPVALGIPGINTREAPYKVIINCLKNLGKARLDAAIGISCLVLLFFLRDYFSYLERRQPSRKRLWSTLSSLRQVFAMLLYTLISFLVNRGVPAKEAKFRIVGHIESGFSHSGVPQPDGELVSLILPELPAIAIILIIEHIAIAKSMGRTFNYTIAPSQEIVALGVANLFSPFVGGYACTGSFGASAVLSKAGVRTPLAGLFSAVLLILALYALTSVFYFIPLPALAGLIIHAVSSFITSPQSLYKYWQLSPLELVIWFVGVMLAVFQSLETSIYATIALSAAVLLVRLSRTRGKFLGKVRIRDLGVSSTIPDDSAGEDISEGATEVGSVRDESSGGGEWRDVFLPTDRTDGTNPKIQTESPYPGVFIYRFMEGFNYTNQAHHVDLLYKHVTSHTRQGSDVNTDTKADRLWCDPGPKPKPAGIATESEKQLPRLHSVIFDFSSVNNVDITSVQGLIDLRNSLDRYASPGVVDWHFSHIYNRWSRRALAVAGFGYPSADNPEVLGKWRAAVTLAALPGVGDGRCREGESGTDRGRDGNSGDEMNAQEEQVDRMGTVNAVDRPFFHVDLVGAVRAATDAARRADAEERV